MKPKVSVVMSVFNETIQELNDSISSILNQTYSNFELIIVDDNPSSLKVRKYLYVLTRNFNNIKLLFNKINMGAALSRDKGEKFATGKFIAIMDADDIASKNRLLDQLRFLKFNKLDFVFPNYNIISIDNDILKKKVYHMHSITNQNQLRYIFSNIRDIAINSGWLMYKYVFDTLSGYNNVIVEDYDFITRAIFYGYKLGFQSKVLMYIRFRNNSIMRKNSLSIFLETNSIKLALKHNNYKNIHNIKCNGKTNNKFNKFIVRGHNLKYNFNLVNLWEFLYSLIITKYAISYVFNKFSLKIKEYIYLR